MAHIHGLLQRTGPGLAKWRYLRVKPAHRPKGVKTDGKLRDHLVGNGKRDVFGRVAFENFAHFLEVFEHVDSGVEQFAVEEPFLETALTPGTEVLRGDTHAVETAGDDLLDFGQGSGAGIKALSSASWPSSRRVLSWLPRMARGKAGDFAAALGESGFGVGGG